MNIVIGVDLKVLDQSLFLVFNHDGVHASMRSARQIDRKFSFSTCQPLICYIRHVLRGVVVPDEWIVDQPPHNSV